MSFDFIYDRTLQDVAVCKQVANEIRSSGVITSEYLLGLKGSINYTDLNRIEGNTLSLSDILNDLGYQNSVTTKTTWAIGDELTLEEVNRIRGNIDILIYSFNSNPEFIDIVYNNTLNYIQANTLEWNLYYLKYTFDKLIVGYLYCGELQSGEGD